MAAGDGTFEAPTSGAGGTKGQRRLSLDHILATALAIADAEGADAISMRRIAAELGAGTMSLYWHFENKEQLIGLMLDAVATEIEMPALPSSDWRGDLKQVASNTRRVLQRHPWVLTFFDAWPGSSVLRREEAMAAIFDHTGVDAATAVSMARLVDEYVVGRVLGELRASQHREPTRFGEALDAALASGDYPRLAAAMANPNAQDPKTHFEFGLERLLDGLAFFIERLAGSGD